MRSFHLKEMHVHTKMKVDNSVIVLIKHFPILYGFKNIHALLYENAYNESQAQSILSLTIAL